MDGYAVVAGKSTDKKGRIVYLKCRSSRPEVFCKKGVLNNVTKITGKHLCQSVFYRTPPVAVSECSLANTDRRM